MKDPSENRKALIVEFARQYERLSRKETDLVGWLQLKFGCTIAEARRWALWYEGQKGGSGGHVHES